MFIVSTTDFFFPLVEDPYMQVSSSSLRGPDSSPSRRTGALRSALATSSHQYRECDFPEAQRDTIHRNPALLWAFRPKI